MFQKNTAEKETEFVSLREMEMCSKLNLHTVTELSLIGYTL